jgi:hypothetical protein
MSFAAHTPIKFKGIIIALAGILVLALCVTLLVMPFSRSCPFKQDAHRLIVKPGRTVPARSLDAAGTGLSYHFTRFDSYKAPDWRPRVKGELQ